VTWFRVDDNLAMHPKVMMAGNAAMGLWVRAGSYCGQHNTDGFLPASMAKTLGTPAQIRALLDAGLWHKCGDGYEFHEWSERQPSREDVEEMREARHSERAASGSQGAHLRWHVKRGVTNPDCGWCQR